MSYTENEKRYDSMECRKCGENELLESACECLRKAKETHDKIEQYYIDIMDFDAMNLYKLKIADEILSQ